MLLKRISTILTAPPKITDEDYQKMKSIVPSGKGFCLSLLSNLN
jgi:hypothetical protein